MLPDGGEVRVSDSGSQPPGFPVVVGAGGVVTVTYDGSTFRLQLEGARAAAFRSRPAVLPQAASEPVELLDEATTSSASTTTTSPTTTSPSTSTTIDAEVPAEPAPGDPSPPALPPTQAPPAELASPAGLWLEPSGGSTIDLPARNRRYRGAIVVGASADGGLKLVNHIDVETYLKGMGEVRDPGWPAAALQTQAVAARTYALRAVQGGAEICDDDRCQVYLGAQAEYAAMNQAVSDTAGTVLKYHGALASTYYSASAGGVTATPEEGFGSAGGASPYLVSAPYPAADLALWTVTVAMADIGPRLDYPGRVSKVAVSRTGRSGRATEVTLDGDAGSREVTGLRFAARLGLRSTLFSFGEPQTAAGAPAPEPFQGPELPPGESVSRTTERSPLTAWSRPTASQAVVLRTVRSAFALGVAALCLAELRRRRTVRVHRRPFPDAGPTCGSPSGR